MKNISIFFFTLLCSTTYSQNFTDFENIKLENSSDYKAEEPNVLGGCIYLLSTPFQKESPYRLQALAFIKKWVYGTPDFNFTIDENIKENLNKNNDLLGLYMVAMVKFSLQNKSSSKNQKLVKLNALKTVLNYCCDPKNNIKSNNHLRKLQKANLNGQLEKYL